MHGMSHCQDTRPRCRGRAIERRTVVLNRINKLERYVKNAELSIIQTSERMTESERGFGEVH